MLLTNLLARSLASEPPQAEMIRTQRTTHTCTASARTPPRFARTSGQWQITVFMNLRNHQVARAGCGRCFSQGFVLSPPPPPPPSLAERPSERATASHASFVPSQQTHHNPPVLTAAAVLVMVVVLLLLTSTPPAARTENNSWALPTPRRIAVNTPSDIVCHHTYGLYHER